MGFGIWNLFSFLITDYHLCFPFGIRFWFLQRCSMLSAKCNISLKYFLQFSPFPFLLYSQALDFLSSHFLCFLPCWHLALSAAEEGYRDSLLHSYRLMLILKWITLVWVTSLGQCPKMAMTPVSSVVYSVCAVCSVPLRLALRVKKGKKKHIF